MPSPKPLEPIELSSDFTIEQLLEVESTKQRIDLRPAELLLNQIHVADQVFQWRLKGLNIAEDERHTMELTRVLLDHEKPLDSILVTAIGSKFFVVDGHHRLQAYHTADWKALVPVEHFEGDVVSACREALRRNSKNKLPMTTADKLEAAWKLVKFDLGMTQQAIVDETTVSRRTISTMAGIFKEHRERVINISWHEARRIQWKTEEDDFNVDSWKEAKARRLAEQLFRNMAADAHKHPDILAMAIQMISFDLAVQLRDCLTEQLVDEFDAEAGEIDL